MWRSAGASRVIVLSRDEDVNVGSKSWCVRRDSGSCAKPRGLAACRRQRVRYVVESAKRYIAQGFRHVRVAGGRAGNGGLRQRTRRRRAAVKALTDKRCSSRLLHAPGPQAAGSLPPGIGRRDRVGWQDMHERVSPTRRAVLQGRREVQNSSSSRIRWRPRTGYSADPPAVAPRHCHGASSSQPDEWTGSWPSA